jgi:hypothetical protein
MGVIFVFTTVKDSSRSLIERQENRISRYARKDRREIRNNTKWTFARDSHGVLIQGVEGGEAGVRLKQSEGRIQLIASKK